MNTVRIADLKIMRRELIGLCHEQPKLLGYAKSGSRWRPDTSKAAEMLCRGSGNLIRRVERERGDADVLYGDECTLARRYLREFDELKQAVEETAVV